MKTIIRDDTERMLLKRSILTALLVAFMTASIAVYAEHPVKRLSKSGINKAFKTAGLGSPFGRHANVSPVVVEGKDVYVLELRDEDGSRASNNYSVNGKKNFRVYLYNVDPGDRLRMRFQRKGDKQITEDSNRGPVLHHSKESLWAMEGSHNYLAERNFNAKDVLQKHPDAVILLVEEGLTIDAVLSAFSD